ncbi:L-seryl-tRNA(Sec) selenium transferase [Parafrankia elaeagni]|uniref:L-seryl-tRNA(Sec) selenium transferase n=1 Tax=Parafrankia elaeagni TaxID=222534 RepID=UPI0003659323|nr:L-seryl-tRNA(Sec) selenium transferase [Parafrankia elaeagni]
MEPSIDTDPRRDVPRTDVVLADDRLIAAGMRLGHERVRAAVRSAQDLARAGKIAPEDVVQAAIAALPARATTLREVVNATGVLLHTNLGRAPLSAAARDAVSAAAGFVDVEYDVETGQRADRGRGTLDALRTAVPDAGDVLVVNNGAAALLLAVSVLAAGREVVISRGELVEIGAGFRLADLVETTGARVREVGATNRATLRDYAEAIGPDTGCVLKVHPSNFLVTGFVAAVPVPDLVTLGRPVVTDIGSGLLRPDPMLPAEPDAASALSGGATLVTASGDKLLGGPQAGLLLGAADVVARARRHPLSRALRVDKITLAALEATLRGPRTPTHEALHVSPAALCARATRLAERLLAAGADARLVATEAAVGGGGAPGVGLPSAAVSLPAPYAIALRHRDPAVVGRVERDRCLLDLRAVPPDRDEDLFRAVTAVHGALS